jgi:hypothetical protein
MRNGATISHMGKKANHTDDRKKDRHKDHKLLRVPLDLYNRLVRIANENDRPVTREGRKALLHHVREEEARLGITQAP